MVPLLLFKWVKGTRRKRMAGCVPAVWYSHQVFKVLGCSRPDAGAREPNLVGPLHPVPMPAYKTYIDFRFLYKIADLFLGQLFCEGSAVAQTSDFWPRRCGVRSAYFPWHAIGPGVRHATDAF